MARGSGFSEFHDDRIRNSKACNLFKFLIIPPECTVLYCTLLYLLFLSLCCSLFVSPSRVQFSVVISGLRKFKILPLCMLRRAKMNEQFNDTTFCVCSYRNSHVKNKLQVSILYTFIFLPKVNSVPVRCFARFYTSH